MLAARKVHINVKSKSLLLFGILCPSCITNHPSTFSCRSFVLQLWQIIGNQFGCLGPAIYSAGSSKTTSITALQTTSLIHGWPVRCCRSALEMAAAVGPPNSGILRIFDCRSRWRSDTITLAELLLAKLYSSFYCPILHKIKLE